MQGSNFLIAYEIHENRKKKLELITKVIHQFQGLHVQPLETAWIVKTSLTPEEMFSALKTFALDDHDYLLITEISENYFGYLKGENWEIINHHIF